MRKWAIFMCSAVTGSLTSQAVYNAQQGNVGYAIGGWLIAAGFTAVAWYHLEKLGARGHDQSLR